MNDKLKALAARHAQERANLQLQLSLEASLPDVGLVPRVHAGVGCYGDVARIQYGDSYSHSPMPMLEQALALAEALPGVPLVQVRDGCLSHQTRHYYDALPEAKRDRVQSELDVCPWLCQWSPWPNGHLALEWHAALASVGQVSVRVLLARQCPTWFGTYSARRVDYRGGYRWENCQLALNTGAIGLVFRDGEPLAEVQTPIRWAAGGPEYQNNFTAYWINYRNDRPCLLADFLRQVMQTK